MEKAIKLILGILGILGIAMLVNVISNIKLSDTNEINTNYPKSYVTSTNVDRTLDCLAMNIYKEAGNESFEGKVAVAQVTLNRVDHPQFPSDVCKVVYQKNVFMERVVCQFSWYCIGVEKSIPTNASYKESYNVAKKVLLEGFRLDSLEDAIYYHAVYVQPNWPYEKITTIGNHIFYRTRKA